MQEVTNKEIAKVREEISSSNTTTNARLDTTNARLDKITTLIESMSKNEWNWGELQAVQLNKHENTKKQKKQNKRWIIKREAVGQVDKIKKVIEIYHCY